LDNSRKERKGLFYILGGLQNGMIFWQICDNLQAEIPLEFPANHGILINLNESKLHAGNKQNDISKLTRPSRRRREGKHSKKGKSNWIKRLCKNEW